MFTEIHCIIIGKVQGVNYRGFVQEAAKKHNLTGWVRNKDDGTVEVVAQGVPDDLKACIKDLHTGPVLAKVESVAVDWRSPEELFDDFSVIF